MKILIVASGFLFLALLGVFVWRNSESQGIVFGYSAILGVILMFFVTLFFELRSNTEELVIPTQAALIQSSTSILHDFYPFSEEHSKKVSETFSNLQKEKTDNQTIKIFNQFTLYSLVLFLLREESDWQKQTEKFVSVKIASSRARGNDIGNDTFISTDVLLLDLKNAGNAFAELGSDAVPMGLYLPPESLLEFKNEALKISNPFCEIVIRLKSDDGKHYRTSPKYGKYEVVNINLCCTVTYKWEYSKSPLIPVYKKWTDGFLESVKNTYYREDDWSKRLDS